MKKKSFLSTLSVSTLYTIQLFETRIGREEEFDEPVTHPLPHIITCWSDGSQNEEGQTGGAYIIRNVDLMHKEYFYLGEEATVFQSEVYAILRATIFLMGKNLRYKTIRFYTDSQATIKALEQPFVKMQSVKKLKDNLNDLGKVNGIIVSWSPGHKGHRGNEIADKLAKLAITDMGVRSVEPEPKLLPGSNHMKSRIKKWGEDQHINKWRESPHAKTLHMMFNNQTVKDKEPVYKWERRDLRTFINTTTGQTGLKKLLFAAGIEDSEGCECGGESEGNLHFLAECERYGRLRHEMFGVGEMGGGGAGGGGVEENFKIH